MSPSNKINALYRLAGGGIIPTGDGTCPVGMTRCDPRKQACPEDTEGIDIRTIDGALCRGTKRVKKMDSQMRSALTTGVRELMRQMVVLVDLNAALDDIMQKEAEDAAQLLARATDELQKNAPALIPGSAPAGMTDLPSFTPDVSGAPLETEGQKSERETEEGLRALDAAQNKEYLDVRGSSDGSPEYGVQLDEFQGDDASDGLAESSFGGFGVYGSGLTENL